MKASYFCVVLLLLGCEKFWPTQTTTNDTEKKEDKLSYLNEYSEKFKIKYLKDIQNRKELVKR